MTPADFLWSLGASHGAVHVVDVGANPIEGDAPYGELLRAGRAVVTGFEPQPQALAALNRKKTSAETYLPYALGDGGTAELRLYAQSGFASLFDIDESRAALVGFGRGTRPAGRIGLETRRLDDLAEIPPIDFLKIDVQGSELAVIRNGRQKLCGAVLVQAEVRLLPLYQGEPTMGEVVAELAQQGFVLHDFAFLKRRPLSARSAARIRPRFNRQLVDGDALFVRDPATAGAMSDAQLWRLSLLAHSVAQSPNLSAFCIEVLEARGAMPNGAANRYVDLLPPQWRCEDAHV